MRRMEIALFEAPEGGPPRLPEHSGRGGRGAPREPLFNAPWPALVLIALIVGGYALQSQASFEAPMLAYAFSPAQLAAGDWVGLVTSLFLHGGWAHALMNAAFALAFGAPVAAFLGVRAGGALLFFAFYIVCGVLANLGYAAVHPSQHAILVGASGAVAGLMGAASRLMAGHGLLGPILSRPVLGMGGAWLAVNLLIGVIGSSLIPGAQGAGIAWEAHVAGFVVGVLLISPVAWLARRA
jgi:membrane associated rhomboid family serine protease